MRYERENLRGVCRVSSRELIFSDVVVNDASAKRVIYKCLMELFFSDMMR